MEVYLDQHLDGSQHVETTVGVDELTIYRAFMEGKCNVIGNDGIGRDENTVRDLGYEGTFKSSNVIHSNDPLAIMSRGDDPEFGDFVNWVIQALITAEQMSITKETAQQFGTTEVFGEAYRNMFIDAIASQGHYREVFDTVPGVRATINFLNNGTTGLIYSHPFGNTRLESEPLVNGTLESIGKRGILQCGIVGGRPGFASYNTNSSQWEGIDVDFCFGVAQALFPYAKESVLFIPYPDFSSGFVGLSNHEVDVLAGAPYNLANDVKEPTTGQGFSFGPVYYHGEGYNNSAMACRQDDFQWTGFVRWMTHATFYAEEEGITSESATDMPIVYLFGPEYKQCFRDVLRSIGNYAEIYERNLEPIIPRSGRNFVNIGGETPQMNPMMEFN